VAQDPQDEPASVLLKKIAAEKARLIKDGKLKKQAPLPPITDDEKPFELPEGWEWVRLGAVITLISGQHLNLNEYTEIEIEDCIPYISGPADFGLNHPEVTRFTKERKAVAEKNDILLTVKGSGVGKLNIASQTELAIGRQIMAVRAVKISLGYLHVWMRNHAKFFQINPLGNPPALPGRRA